MMSTPETVTIAIPEKPLHKNEQLKAESNFLRGNIRRDLADTSTGAISEESGQLTKFHGIYMQDDRDVRNQRRKEGKEKAFIFMARVRVPGGVCQPAQWLELDRLADSHANGTLKITTRQAFQLHGVVKGNLRPLIQQVNLAAHLNTIAACGDINRNVMCNTNPELSSIHAEVLRVTRALSNHLLPRSRAYHELWVDDKLVTGGEPEDEPIYGKTYLPRKFKIVVAVPPSNDVDIYAHDLGFIAILDDDNNVTGWNVTVGGGMGMTHGEPDTYPRAADVMGFCETRDAIAVAEAVVTVQRDWGDRTNRKHARLKYTIEDRGLVAFRTEVEKRAGVTLGAAKPFTFTSTGDRYGWTEGENGMSHLTLYVANGRIHDQAGG